MIGKDLPFGKNIKETVAWIVFFSLFLVGLGNEVNAAVILSPSFSISERYNDNLFFTETDRKSDFTTVISPALNLAFTSRNVHLTMGYRGSAEFHSKNPKADGYFQSLSFDIDLPALNRQIRGLEVSVTENISYSPELPAFSFGSREADIVIEERFDRVLLAGEGVQTGRVDTFRNRAGLSVRYAWSRNFNTTASYTSVITRYSGSDLEDNEVNTGSFDATYSDQTSPRTKWTSRYGLSIASSDNADSNRNEDLIQQIALEVAHRVTHFLSVSGDIGTSFVEGESPRLPFGASI